MENSSNLAIAHNKIIAFQRSVVDSIFLRRVEKMIERELLAPDRQNVP
jgi:hypothetical protein